MDLDEFGVEAYHDFQIFLISVYFELLIQNDSKMFVAQSAYEQICIKCVSFFQ